MNVELKPCPWCGGQLKEGLVLEGETFRWRRVQGCCTDGPEVRIDTLSDDREEAEREAKEQAYEAWNTRAPIAVPDGWVLMPRVLTEEMLQAGYPAHDAQESYEAMIAARPEVSP